MPREADYVTTAGGGYELQFPVVHPSGCVCKLCPKRRAADEWDAPFIIRTRRRSPHPQSRVLSAAAALELKASIESELQQAVDEARRNRDAVARQVSLKQIADHYRAEHRRQSKRLDRDRYIITAIERFFGERRDPTTITKTDHKAFCASIRDRGCAEATVRRHTNTLVAMLNLATRDELIPAHRLVGIARAKVKLSKPKILTSRQVAVLLGPAMDAYEAEQLAAIRAFDPATRRKPPTRVPLRGLTLIAYLTLMRPANNFGLMWEQVTLHATRDEGSFRLVEHKNAKKGVDVEGALHPTLVRYLRAIQPERPSGLIHPNAETRLPYRNIRMQWARLVELANTFLKPEERIEGVVAHFYTLRHSGASALAASSGDPVLVMRLMGDASLTTVMKHYFSTELDRMVSATKAWKLPTWIESENESGK